MNMKDNGIPKKIFNNTAGNRINEKHHRLTDGYFSEAGTTTTTTTTTKTKMIPIPVAELSKAMVYGRWLAGITGSNPDGCLDVCVL
jgi:hypothetical protein